MRHKITSRPRSRKPITFLPYLFLPILFTFILAGFVPAAADVSGVPAQVGPKGTLATNSGPSIYDHQLRAMLDQFIPPANAHSTLLVFTECYGGDKLDDFASRAGTTAISATSPGEPAYYGGYHDDAAGALRPGDGRTSDDVHNAGVAGKDPQEHPQSQGEPVSLESTSPTGEIQSRHVLVYAGQPEGPDTADRDKIEENFAGEANTTVTTVGSDGSNGWDHPGTLEGLRTALQQIGDMMNPNEQFILFVTDHGNIDLYDSGPTCGDGACTTSEPLPFGDDLYEDLLEDANNQPMLSLFAPEPSSGPVTVTMGTDTFFDVFFEIPIDLNGDEVPEEWLAQVPVDEAQIDPAGETVTVSYNPDDVTFTLNAISLESGAIAKKTPTRGTLATNSGPSIYDEQLRKMLDEFIPPANAHSTLLVFTECFGGDKLDDFAGREGTTAISATSPGELAYYGGYHDDAASALRPGAGRTSDDVHNAGVAGKDPNETPQSQGEPVSLESPSQTGEIQSRHVLVYAGQPEGPDVADRDKIEENFAGEENTTVTTVGSDGTNGWDHPGTLEGLRDALEEIGEMMNPNEQFILFVTDHGDLDRGDKAPTCEEDSCTTMPLALGEALYGQMLNDAHNQPAVSLFTAGPAQPTMPVSVTVGSEVYPDVVFDIQIDLNGDGNLEGDGEGWQARVPVDEAKLDPLGETIVVTGENGLTLSFISLESGELSKIYPYAIYLPMIQQTE